MTIFYDAPLSGITSEHQKEDGEQVRLLYNPSVFVIKQYNSLSIYTQNTICHVYLKDSTLRFNLF